MKRWWEWLISGADRNRPGDAGGRSWVFCWLFGLLRIMSVPYHLISKVQLSRRLKKRSRDWKAKVISIGNITVGGSGKTPLAIYLADLINRQDKKVVIVHSGYGRRLNEECVIVPGEISRYTAAQIGDEVAMMGQRLPFAGFAVGANKKRMVTRADLMLKPDIILIDDGFQRLDIAKDLDIVIISSDLLSQFSGETAPTSRYLFPRGVLRESIESLQRADLIFLLKESEAGSDYSDLLKTYNNRAIIVPWAMALEGVEIDGDIKDLSILNGRRPYVFASIGSFYRMIRMLKTNGVAMAGDQNFGDHHNYVEKDFHDLRRRSDHYSADCYLTTAKDMVKLSPEALDKPVYCLQLGLRPVDNAGLKHVIGMVLS